MSNTKLIEFPMVLHGEMFNTLTEACLAYGINTRFVSNFYSTSPTVKDAFLNALRYKDVQSIYGITLKLYTSNLAKMPKTEDWEKKSRVITIQRNLKIDEEFDKWQHEVVKRKCEMCVTKLKRYVELRNNSLYNKTIEQGNISPISKRSKHFIDKEKESCVP